MNERDRADLSPDGGATLGNVNLRAKLPAVALSAVTCNLRSRTDRDGLNLFIGDDDSTFVAEIAQQWGAWNYGCADWLNDPKRKW